MDDDFHYPPERIARQLDGAATWDRNGNLRDVLDRRDLRLAPELTAAVIVRRLREGHGPEPLIPLPYPKDDGTTRQTCLLDPFDDLRLMLLASAVAPAVDRALPGPDIVLSTRFLPKGPGVFYAEDWRDARKRKRRIVTNDGDSGIGGFDVEKHYPTVRTDQVARLLNSIGVPTRTVDEIVSMLNGFAVWPSSPLGLPAGPMASALFGTLVLLPVDRTLHGLAVPYERWVDDFVVNAPDRSTFDAVVEAVNEQLDRMGQRLNPTKTWYEDPVDEDESMIEADYDMDHDSDNVSLEALEVAVEGTDAKRCRFVLGGLRSRSSPAAAAFVATRDETWELAPKHSGDYLVACRESLTDGHIDALAERCIRIPNDRSAAGIAHCGRVLATRRVSADLGPALHDAADRSSTSRYRAVSPTLYRAASVSRERASKRHGRSLETAASLRELNSQRGLLDGLAVDTPARNISSALSALERAHPDLAPTAAWIRSRQKL